MPYHLHPQSPSHGIPHPSLRLVGYASQIQSLLFTLTAIACPRLPASSSNSGSLPICPAQSSGRDLSKPESGQGSVLKPFRGSGCTEDGSWILTAAACRVLRDSAPACPQPHSPALPSARKPHTPSCCSAQSWDLCTCAFHSDPSSLPRSSHAHPSSFGSHFMIHLF